MSNCSPLKKILLTISLAISTGAMADTSNSAFNGYYGGISGGIMRTESKITNSVLSQFSNSESDFNFLVLEQNNIYTHKTDGTGDIFLGYGHFFGNTNFYWAGEIFFNWAQRKNTLNNQEYFREPETDADSELFTTTNTLRLQNSEFGLDFRPGYLFDTNTMVYGRIGVAFNKVKNTISSNFTFFDNNPPGPIYDNSASISQSKQKAALRLGLGLEQMVTKNVAVTADYIYTYYGKVSTSGFADTISRSDDGDVGVVNSNGLELGSSGRMSTQAGMIGIKYYFLTTC